MSHAFEPQPDDLQWAQQAFASQGFTPSEAVLKAAAKGLARLRVVSTASDKQEPPKRFADMLKRCADA